MKALNQTFSAFAVATMLSGGSALAVQEPVPQPLPQEAPQPAPTHDIVPLPEPQAAPAPDYASENSTATGELVKVDAEAKMLTIKAADGKEWSFTYNDDTEVAGAQEGVAGLATDGGTLVTVHFDGDDDARIATKVEVAPKQ